MQKEVRQPTIPQNNNVNKNKLKQVKRQLELKNYYDTTNTIEMLEVEIKNLNNDDVKIVQRHIEKIKVKIEYDAEIEADIKRLVFDVNYLIAQVENGNFLKKKRRGSLSLLKRIINKMRGR